MDVRKKFSKFWRENRVFTQSFLIALPCFFLVISAAFHLSGIRINVTRSFPLGFYLLEKGEYSRGDLVFIKPPENAVVKWGRKTGAISRPIMLKRVYGMEGDIAEISREGVRINGVLIEKSKVIEELPNGTPIPSMAQSGVIPQNRVWVMSEYNERSFDSRYFGSVPSENILAKARPHWVW